MDLQPVPNEGTIPLKNKGTVKKGHKTWGMRHLNVHVCPMLFKDWKLRFHDGKINHRPLVKPTSKQFGEPECRQILNFTSFSTFWYVLHSFGSFAPTPRKSHYSIPWNQNCGAHIPYHSLSKNTIQVNTVTVDLSCLHGIPLLSPIFQAKQAAEKYKDQLNVRKPFCSYEIWTIVYKYHWCTNVYVYKIDSNLLWMVLVHTYDPDSEKSQAPSSGFEGSNCSFESSDVSRKRLPKPLNRCVMML